MVPIGEYLYKLSQSNADLYYKTGISQARLSILRNTATAKLYAEELYLIALAINEVPGEMAKEMFRGLKLSNSSRPAEKIQDRNLTKFGLFIEEKSRNQKAIQKKTGISENRLSILSNKLDSRVLARELYLVALAMEIDPQEIWDYLFGHLEINSPERQEELKNQESKKRKAGK